MSVHVASEFHTTKGRGGDLVALLRKVLPDSLKHDGGESISIQVNQDDADNVISFTVWRTRKHYDDYLRWRTDKGDTATFDEMLETPMAIRYFDAVEEKSNGPA